MPATIVLDIETQGLSSSDDLITCIGIITPNGIRQFSSPVEEWKASPQAAQENLLFSFMSWLNSISQKEEIIFITYNGISFDVPFIQKKMPRYGETTMSDNAISTFTNLAHVHHVDLSIFAKRFTGRYMTKDEACRKLADLYVPRKSEGLWSARIYKYPEALTTQDHIRMLQHNAVDLGVQWALYERLKDFPDFREWEKTIINHAVPPIPATIEKPSKEEEIEAFV